MTNNWVFLCKEFFCFDLNYGMETNLPKLGAACRELWRGRFFLMENINLIYNQKKYR